MIETLIQGRDGISVPASVPVSTIDWTQEIALADHGEYTSLSDRPREQRSGSLKLARRLQRFESMEDYSPAHKKKAGGKKLLDSLIP